MEEPNEQVLAALQQLSDLEKDFANVELDFLRRKEYSLKPLFTKRQAQVEQIPDFWSSVFLNGPEEVQRFFTPADLPILSALQSLNVERYGIISETEGEPRNLRFTFEFAENEVFEDKKVTKEFQYKPDTEGGSGGLVSKPVALKWRSKKKDTTGGLLDAASELYEAEEALKLKNNDKSIDVVERESLWQHEKLREKLAKVDENPDVEPSFLNWFAYRGPVGGVPRPVQDRDGEGEVEVDEDDPEDGMLEVEVFPPGEEVALALAEDLWPNVMDYFLASQEEPIPDFDDVDFLDVEEDEDEDAPALVAEEPVVDDRPSKRQKRA